MWKSSITNVEELLQRLPLPSCITYMADTGLKVYCIILRLAESEAQGKTPTAALKFEYLRSLMMKSRTQWMS